MTGAPGGFQHLKIGSRYRVRRPVTDFDGPLHQPGETWTFRGHGFLPYEDGLTLYIDPGGSIRLRWTPEDQGPVIDRLADHLEPDPAGEAA